MKMTFAVVAAALASLASTLNAPAAVRYVDLNSANPAPPFTNWTTAAANIQIAIDAADAGDVIWVTNGVYATGGKVMAGNLTNRVALNKAVTVWSVNGPEETVIQGQWDAVSTNGPGAVRCAWLADGAVLNGFTLRGGATRSAGDSGGGVWCATINAVVANCVITGNSAGGGGGSYYGTLNNCILAANRASGSGGGSYYGTLNNCTLTANRSLSDYDDGYSGGGGSYYGTLNNCALTANSASESGGGSFYSTLNNCTLTGNSASYGTGGGDYGGTLNNCIVWGNERGGYSANYSRSTLQYTCASPLASGLGNIAVDPQLLADGVHIDSTSPCRTNGNALYASGTDIDGQAWANPPSMGCDQWQPQPMVIGTPWWRPAANPGQVLLVAVVAGQGPFACWWTKDGAPIEDGTHYGGALTTTLLVRGFGLDDAGAYQLVVSNAFGLAISQVVRLVIHCVDAAAATPLAPYTNWATAAAAIQDAIDAADAGDVIWVTNGVYATGGKVMDGDLTNRVALEKAVVVWSVNGPAQTAIQGQWDSVSTNGPGAVRCAWLANGAVLDGFTLRGGATRTNSGHTLGSGGGVWCASTNAVVANCVITGNAAYYYGGGSSYGTLNNCTLTGNSARADGGGSYFGTLNNCTLTGNSAGRGGGTYSGTCNNCTLTGNSAAKDGGGAFSCMLNNCTLTGNSASQSGGGSWGSTLNNCTLTGNLALSGGGAYDGTLNNCILTSNSAGYGGGYGVQLRYPQYGSTLNNCTLTGNSASYSGGGTYYGTLNNCIVWGNVGGSSANYYSSTLRYTCTSPLASGIGNSNNIAVDPQLLADGAHLASTSPCRTNGNALYASGTDIDGQAWTNPPSMGCDQWQPQPVVTGTPWWQPAANPGQTLLVAVVAGQGPFVCWWTKDGVAIEDGARYGGAHTTTLLVRGFGLTDAGAYQVVVSNAFGMATSPVARVVVHCVDAATVTPRAPYTNWAVAAATIQDAIDAAAPSAVVLVTNGVYAAGGKVMAGDLTNRVALDKAVMVWSVNGPAQTAIQGQWDSVSTNGPGAVRCAWLANGGVLNGFTLRSGATRSAGTTFTGDIYTLRSGGGAWCAAVNSVVANCVITGNSARFYGGGSYLGTLNNCALTSNSAQYGGGSSYGTLNNCNLTANSAGSGGGACYGTLNNCTLTGNSASYGSGASGGLSSSYVSLNNCIVWGNAGNSSYSANYYYATLRYTCSSPLASGLGNTALDPQLVDGAHIAVTSPCRGKGSSLYASGTDIDGESWTNPPAMGCDEVWAAGLTGPLSVAITAAQPEVVVKRALGLTGWSTGRVARVEWAFGDGSVATNVSYQTAHVWTNTGDYTVTFTAFNMDHPAGVSTNLLVHVVPLELPVLAAGGMSSNSYQLTFGSQTGVYYVVEYATNLTPPMVWQTLQSRTSTGGVIQVRDSNATNAARFYRVRMP